MNVLLLFALFFICGAIIGNRLKTIRRRFQKYTDIYFLDLNKHYTHYGESEDVNIMDATYIIDWNKVKNNMAFFDSRYAEKVNIDISEDFGKWKYYIDSKEFNRAYKNKVLEKMMLIQESNYILIILIAVIISVIISIGAFYKISTLQDDILQIGQIVTNIQVLNTVG